MQHFDNFSAIFEEHEFDSNLVYNMDEAMVKVSGSGKKAKVLAPPEANGLHQGGP